MGLWHLAESDRAILVLGPWRGELDLRRPDRGLGLHHQPAGPDANVLAVGVEEAVPEPHYQLAECYLRDSDLVATYDQPRQGTIRPQLYWTARDLGDNELVVDLQVLVQTSLLKSRPRTRVRTLLPGRLSGLDRQHFRPLADVQRATDTLVAEAGLWCFAVLGHPADGGTMLAQPQASSWSCGTDLFAQESLEKGVIQRGRVRLAVLRSEHAWQRVLELREEFISSPPPLAV